MGIAVQPSPPAPFFSGSQCHLSDRKKQKPPKSPRARAQSPAGLATSFEVTGASTTCNVALISSQIRAAVDEVPAGFRASGKILILLSTGWKNGTIFNLETAQTPTSPSNSKNFMHRVLLSTGVLAVVLASVLLTLYTGLYYWLKLHVKLYQISSCTDQAKARIWYRRLEPLWAKCRYVQKKCPPKWRALDLSRWAALERLAFGNLKDQDQNPIR
jgi:hypothetical protein